MSKTFYYAVAKGRKPGIYNSWNECEAQVHKFSGPVYKKFSSKTEAEDFIRKKQSSSTARTTKSAGISHKSVKGISKRTLPTDSLDDKSVKRRKICLIDSVCENKTDAGGFTVDNDGYVNVYTDGACSSNGRKDPKAGIGVWFGDNHPLNVSGPVIGRATNNVAEIQAVTTAIRKAKEAGVEKLKINTDSQFLISCITKWMPKWKRNGWKTAKNEPVINKMELIEMEKAISSLKVSWNHVRGHVGIRGNEMADELARAGCLKYQGECGDVDLSGFDDDDI